MADSQPSYLEQIDALAEKIRTFKNLDEPDGIVDLLKEVIDVETSAAHGTAVELMYIVGRSSSRRGAEPISMEERRRIIPAPWTQTPRPHPKTTRLARFPTEAAGAAYGLPTLPQTIHQARCEVSANALGGACPIGARIAPADSSVLAVVSELDGSYGHAHLDLFYLDPALECGAPDSGGAKMHSADGFRHISIRTSGMRTMR
ncbi:hypothetical protein OH77DRAFT_1523847 [Trametes cingulata]|nr:hypothetical protein OH77DRAFT_1523847 [Trametes cingulata]